MNDDVKPVRLSELPSLIQEFFSPDYVLNRNGLAGVWRGSDFPVLRTVPEMTKENFANVFSFHSWNGKNGPSKSWQESNPVIAQRLTFDSSPELSTLWALGDQQQRLDIIRTVQSTTKQTMGYIWDIANLESESSRGFLSRGCRFAQFLERVSPEQTPRLRTTVLIAQQYRIWGNKEVTFPLEFEPGTPSALFRRCEWRRLTDRIGTFGMTPKTRIPKNLFSPPSHLPPSAKKFPTEQEYVERQENNRLSWRQQAAEKGFGPEDVQVAFQAAKRLGNIVNLLRNNLTPLGPKVFTEAAIRLQGGRGFTRKPEVDHSTRPSL